MSIIEVENVSKVYGEQRALDNISLSVQKGEIFGLLGTNGAGKSTLFRLLVGHIQPTSGNITINGEDVEKAGPKIREEVGYLPELADFPRLLTAKEILSFHAKMRNITNQDQRIGRVLSTVGLKEDQNRPIKEYSKGMKRRLGLATSLLGDTDILLLDEPTVGLDPIAVKDFHEMIKKLRENTDITVLLSSHVLTEVERLCDRIMILHEGKIRSEGKISDLKKMVDNRVTLDLYFKEKNEADETIEFLENKADIEKIDSTHIKAKCERSKARYLYKNLPREPDVSELYETALEDVFKKVIEDGNS